MGRLKVTQVKSGIGGKQNQRDTLRTLGLKRINDTVVKETPLALATSRIVVLPCKSIERRNGDLPQNTTPL